VNPVLLIARKEYGEVLQSSRGLSWLLAASVVLSGLSLLFVSNTELSLLDNAQVVYMMMGTVTALAALFAVVLGADAIAGERERGSLVLLLLTPVSAINIVFGKMSGQVIGWAVMYVLALPYLWAVGSTGQNLLQAIAYLALFGTPLVLGFGFFSLGLSARLQSVRTALLASLIALLLLASPLLLGPGLRQTAVGVAFDAINPFAAGLNSYDSVVIDSEPLVMQLPRLAVALIWLAITFWFARRGIETASAY
jgi:ABC-type transport system involved in multi-copper enzyme maturation permease subunit